jgi:hypothetical protein
MSRRIREHATLQKRLPYLPRVSEASWNIRSYKSGKTRNGEPTWADCILPLHQQKDPLKNSCCLFTHRCKKVHLEKPVIDPSFVGIVSFRGDDWIMSVSSGGKPDFEEFTLSCLYQQYQT